MLEILATLALTAVCAQTGAGAMTVLSRSIGVEAARLRVMGALVEARRAAYASQQTVEVAAAAGERDVVVTRAGETLASYALPRDASIRRSNAAGRVRFFASGFAENATIVVGADDVADEPSIVVNQRGAIR
jgi:hypothetical protein